MSKSRPLYGVATPEFARIDVGLALASLFRPSFRKTRAKGMDVTQEFNGLTLRFVNYETLDVHDQSVLLGALGLAGIARQTIHKDSAGEIGVKLWKGLAPEKAAIDDESVTIKTTYYQLLDAAGSKQTTGQEKYERLKECLFRLASVSCRAKKNGYDWSMRLLSYEINDNDGTIRIAFNSRLAASLVGQHSRTSLVERRELKSDIAKIAHFWLSAWANKASRIGINTLAMQLYGDDVANPATQRSRWADIRRGLEEIGSLTNWTVQIDGKGGKAIATIWRSNESIKTVSETEASNAPNYCLIANASPQVNAATA